MTAFNDKKITHHNLKIKSNGNDLYLTDEKGKKGWGVLVKKKKKNL